MVQPKVCVNMQIGMIAVAFIIDSQSDMLMSLSNSVQAGACCLMLHDPAYRT